MDEYVGIPRDHPESYHSFMWNNFFRHIDVTPSNVNLLDGNAVDLQVGGSSARESGGDDAGAAQSRVRAPRRGSLPRASDVAPSSPCTPPISHARPAQAECDAYENKIAAYGGIELFLGGIGPDGHIAFNEPG